MRTLALIRVSTDKRLNGVSVGQTVENQREPILRWAAAQDPPRTVEFVPERVSGAAAVRPGLDVILKQARRGKVDEVVVVALDRLGRSLMQVVAVLDELHRLGVRAVSLRESIDFGTPAGRLQVQLIAAFAEFEREIIRERTKAGMTRIRDGFDRTGKWSTRSGRPPGRPQFLATPEQVSRLLDLLQTKTYREIAASGFPLTDTAGKTRNAGATALRAVVQRATASRADGVTLEGVPVPTL